MVNNILQSNSATFASHDVVVAAIKKYFYRFGTSAAIKLAEIIIDGQDVCIDLSRVLKRNKAVLRDHENNIKTVVDEQTGETKHYINEQSVAELREIVNNALMQIGTSLKEIESGDNADDWESSKIDGVDVYEVSNATTFQDIREKLDNEGKHVQFRYNFKNAKKDVGNYDNKLTTQIVDIHVNDSGEYFDFPLNYFYHCPICGQLSKRMEYDVASSNNKHKCTTVIPTEDGKARKCSALLSPDNNRTETKECYAYKISFKNKGMNESKAQAIAFTQLPKGYLRVAVQKIPNSFNQMFLHIVDYQPLKKEPFKLPKKADTKHYVISLTKAVDRHIKNKTNYTHYGFMPMKIAMIIQMAARYNAGFRNDFNICLTGARSSGKSQFAKYWGMTLYAESSLPTVATSLSIPALRGTMETFNLFGKDRRYQSKGYFGEKDLLIIDELKENPDLKDNLKQYLLEPNYDYSKQGGSGQSFPRTAQAIVTQNVDTKHLDRYAKDVKKVYQAENLQAVDNNDPKPAWNPEIDLTLPLNHYDNRFLRYAIRKVRDEYERNEVNWIDGSDLALKQRFFFYFFLGSSKMNSELTNVIRENSINEIVSDTNEIIKIMDSEPLRDYFKSISEYAQGTNDIEYFEKIDLMLKEYDKRTDARTKSMSYAIIRLLRMIDCRKECNDSDLELFQYILESLDNKVEAVDTNKIKITGPQIVQHDDGVEEKLSDEDAWGYSSGGLEDFKK